MIFQVLPPTESNTPQRLQTRDLICTKHTHLRRTLVLCKTRLLCRAERANTRTVSGHACATTHTRPALHTHTHGSANDRDVTRPQPARCTMQATHANTRRERARSGRSSSNRRLTDASDSRVHRVSARRADVTVTLARSQHARCGRCQHSRARNAKRGASAYLRHEWTRNHGACCSLADQEAAQRRAEISTQSATMERARAA